MNTLDQKTKKANDTWDTLRDVAADEKMAAGDDAWKAFPLNALPPVMEQFASEIGRTLCVDASLPALPMISIAGALIGNTSRARMSSDYHAPPNIWSGGVLRSGEKKTPVLTAIMKPIYEAQAKAAKEHAEKVAEYDHEIEQWREKPKGERGDRPLEPSSFPHLYIDDATPEAVAVRLQEQPRGLADVMHELSALFSGMNQYRSGGGHDRETWLAFYDAGAAKIDRKTATPPTIFIPRAFVTVIGMTQPGVLASILRPGDFASGLPARFIFTSPPPQKAKWIPDGVAEHIRNGWSNLLVNLLSLPLPELPILIPPSDAAMRLFQAAHDRMEGERFNEVDDRIRAARAKLIGAIPRMALIFQMVSAASGELAASVKVIDQLSMERAIEIVEWSTRETRRVYGLLADEGNEDDVIHLIEQRGGEISARTLMQACRRFRSSAQAAESYLNSLVSDGMGRWIWRQTGGRPTKVFTLLSPGNGNESLAGDSCNGGSVTVTNVTSKNSSPLEGVLP